MIAQLKYGSVLAAVLLGLGSASSARADNCDLVEQAVEDLGAREGYYQVYPITDDYVARTFPNLTFCAVIFVQWPIAVNPPEGLSRSNVGVVQSGNVSFVIDVSQLRDFSNAQLGPVPTPDAALDAGRSWLRLSEELKQDLFFRFLDPIVNYRLMDDGSALVTGQVDVVRERGDDGAIIVKMMFDPDANLVKVQEISTVRAGVRPICQATKLLDRDPIVRRMAERDLLVMGRTAKPYLDERRAKAGPKLRRAIDRIWQRILNDER